MAECTCFPTPPEMWTTHYGAVDPATTLEPNPDCPEHFPNNQQYCVDCKGTGRVPERGLFTSWEDCPTCDGAGVIHRLGPYRLHDGTWSDGVDRTHVIPSHQYSKANPDRVYVHGTWEQESGGAWKPLFDVWRGDTCIKPECSFEEAIAYADKQARGQA